MEGFNKKEIAPAEITLWAKMMVADMQEDISHLEENGSFELLPPKAFFQQTDADSLKRALETELLASIPGESFVVTMLQNPDNIGEKAFRITKKVDVLV